ncbi:MAG TPA: NfeD family protein [Actinomycetes bacterium]|nr:NfeD family protein [Actinomycetes bacterium]
MPEWVWWVVVALALAAVEVLSLDLIFGMIAVGALAAGIVAVAGGSFMFQVLSAAVVSLLLLFAVRPIALRHLRSSPQARTNVEALVGSGALVLQRVDRHTGLVKLGGEDWTARSLSPDSSFEPGANLTVVRIDGATAIVDRPAPPPAPSQE